MSETTQIHPDTILAYLARDYRLGLSENDIIFTIGKRSERLAVLFASRGVYCGALDGIDQRSFDIEPAVTVVAEDADEAADCYHSDKCH